MQICNTLGIILKNHNWSEPDRDYIEEVMMRNKASVNMLVIYRRIFQLPAVLQKNLVMVKEFLEPEQKEPKYVLANVYFELYKKVPEDAPIMKRDDNPLINGWNQALRLDIKRLEYEKRVEDEKPPADLLSLIEDPRPDRIIGDTFIKGTFRDNK